MQSCVILQNGSQRHVIIHLMFSLLNWACCYHRCVLIFYTNHLILTDTRRETRLAVTSVLRSSGMHDNLQN